MTITNPILNSPYEEPQKHYATADDGSLNYDSIIKGRRIFTEDIPSIPVQQGDQSEIFEINDHQEKYGKLLVNLIRDEISKWREAHYPNTTRITRELLQFWFDNPERHAVEKLFFAQREAIETAIYLNEVADKSNPGTHILNRLNEGLTISENADLNLPRIAFKMATGTGKTVVMAALILYHFFNRQEYRNDTRFADNFLIVTPGITIRDRLGVLKVDTNKYDPKDYYHVRALVPRQYEQELLNLNSRIVITNYHQFEPRVLQGNKRSPFDGKVDAEGNKHIAREDFNQVAKRLLGGFKRNTRLLILNDEAHHCYLPRAKGKKDDDNSQEENARAAVWFSGLTEIGRRYKVNTVYDLSATPYFLSGSGYPSYSLFPWVVSDFGLIEAIESGLVKIPYLPTSDSTQELQAPVLLNLYEHVKKDLPRKGQKRKRSEAKEKGENLSEEPPKLPALVKGALDQFYNHYKKYYKGYRERQELQPDLFSTPPVFIIVCNNTSVSKEVYKFIAGYVYTNLETGENIIMPGQYALFSNFNRTTNLPLRKAPTLLIDSDALENSDQINDDFKKVFAPEVEEFKKEYARLHGQGSVENITDAQILREVVNTVGKPNMLGSHIRCVVSVSMLTEGWDANTVTHIMGIRAFGSQLLCEQVAGRALRRQNYFLQRYDSLGNPTEDRRKAVIEKFPPEYAHIIGVPFKMFKGGEASNSDPKPTHHIHALEERADMEITFPNIIGYREKFPDETLTADFSNVPNYTIDGTKFPVETTLSNAFSPHHEKISVQSILEKREQEIIFNVTKELIKYHFSDDDGNPKFHKFSQLKAIVQEWYDTRIELLNILDSRYKKLVFYENLKKVVDHIRGGINPHLNNETFIRPIFNHYNPFGSTKYVNGTTSRNIYETVKSHVNYMVADTDSWEQIAAKALEELDEVECYVKNAFLGFAIPYLKDGEDKEYYPDFIVRIKAPNDHIINLVLEISGYNDDKEEKKWTVENRWLPAVNAVREKYEYEEWVFLEVTDISRVKNEIVQKINKNLDQNCRRG